MKKGLFIFILLLSAFLFQKGEDIHADEAIIQVDHLNVRTGPGTNYEKIGKVQSDESYTIAEEKHNWLKIHWQEKTGWVAKWLTKVKADENATHETTYSSKVDYLRIRSTPGLDGKIKGFLMKNDDVQSSEKNGKWLRIQQENVTGWVHGDYLTENKPESTPTEEEQKPQTPNTSTKGKVKVGTSVLNVRSQGSTKGKVLAQVRKGQIYEYIDEQDRWYHIKLADEQNGWVAGWLVNKVKDQPTSSPSKDLSEARYVSLNYNATNLRSGPSTNDKIVGRGSKGEQYEILAKEGQWYNIRYQQKEAYVAGWIVQEHKKQSTSTPQASGDLKGQTIMIDAGHGGRDPGAIGRNGSYEKTLTLQTANRLKKHLEQKGAKVLMTRTEDEYLSLSLRSYYSNRSKADAFISLHYNSAPLHVIAKGINSYYYHSKDKRLAATLQSSMVDYTGLRDRGAKKGNFHVVRENNKPAVLLELGFLSDAREEQTLRSTQYQQQISQGITQGLIGYFQ